MEPQITKWDNGNIFQIKYFNEKGKLHREDGPAIQRFFRSGKIDYQYWYINGELHRTDGSAYISLYPDGSLYNKEYYINDKELTEQEFLVYSRKRKLKKIWNQR